MNIIKPIKILTPEQLQEKAHTLAMEISSRYKAEIIQLINAEIANAESIETMNVLAKLKRRATMAWIHTAA